MKDLFEKSIYENIRITVAEAQGENERCRVWKRLYCD